MSRNDLQAGCEHQRAEGWEDARINPLKLPQSHANRDNNGILAIWVSKAEHPMGLLAEPCKICGYKYGTAWLEKEIPEDIIMEIQSWEA